MTQLLEPVEMGHRLDRVETLGLGRAQKTLIPLKKLLLSPRQVVIYPYLA